MSDEWSMDLARRLLELPPGASPRQVVRAARRSAVHLPHLILSIAERDGLPMGTGSRDELRRARDRAAVYREVHAATPDGRVAIIKGASIAVYYPERLLRPVGDVDLVAADEPALWETLRGVLDRYPVTNIDLGVFLQRGRLHWAVRASWPPPDPLLDSNLRVEVSTAALLGDASRIPVRLALPDDSRVAGLLAVAEERIQRDFSAKDIFDLFALRRVEPTVALLVTAAAEWHLAPELAELIDYGRRFVDDPWLATVADALRGPARAEAAARADPSGTAGPDEAPEAGVPTLLRSGRPVYGVALRRTVSDRRAWSRAVFREAGEGIVLLLTPIADYLLVDRDSVTQEHVDSARRLLTALAG